MIVGDHRHGGIKRIGLAVERLHLLAVPGETGLHIALQLVGVEDMQRTPAVMCNQVRHIDQRGNRAQTHGLQLVLHPFGRRTVLHIADVTPRKNRAGIRRIGREVQRDRLGAFEFAFDDLDAPIFQRAKTGSRQIARHAERARRIAPIGRDGDVDHGIGETQRCGGRRAHFRAFGKFDDAVVFVGKKQLALRTQHATRFHAANGADFQHFVAGRNHGARPREHAFHARVRVGRTADDLNRCGLANIHHAKLQLVRIGMFLGGNDIADHEILQPRARVFHRFHFETDGGELIGHHRCVGIGIEMILDPGEREFHRAPPKDGTRRRGGAECAFLRVSA